MTARLLRAAIFMTSFLLGGAAFAAGGTCPSGANYVSLANPTGSLVTLSSLGVTNCYYIAANGSDSNDGLSEAAGHPWAHAPGMPNCTGSCASNSPTGGYGYIFRGGDAWHFGNSSATPYVGGQWVWPTGGSSQSSPVYIGVDLSWYSGSSWSRPVLNGDNPLTPNPGVILDFVASCTYQVPGGNDFVNVVTGQFTSQYYTIFDYFEFTGMCQNDTGQPSGHDEYLSGYNNSATTANWLERLYLHGWTHTNYDGNAPSNANVTIYGVGSQVAYRFDVVDGSDSDPGAPLTFSAGSAAYDVAYSVFRYTAEMIGGNCHLFHDNLVEHWAAEVHPNVFECVGEPANSVGAYYNNVFRHICTDNDPHGTGFCSVNPGVVGIWPEPPTTTKDYWFNNIMYDETSVEYFNIGQNSVAQGPLVIFNNTMEYASPPIFGCAASGLSFPVTFANNHYISDSTPYSSTCAGQTTPGAPTTDRIMSHAAATTAGYTAGETYAYSPTSGTSPTVGTGTNENASNGAFCSALSTAAASDSSLSDAASACQNDTRYACKYNSSDHTVSCPTRTANARPASAWDVGAYQYSSTQAAAPNPPSNLQAIVQ